MAGIQVSNVEQKVPEYIGVYSKNLTFHNDDNFGELYYVKDPTTGSVIEIHNAWTIQCKSYVLNQASATYCGARQSITTYRSPDTIFDYQVKMIDEGSTTTVSKWFFSSGAENAKIVWQWVEHTNQYSLNTANNNSVDVIAYTKDLNISWIIKPSTAWSSLARGNHYYGWRINSGIVPTGLSRDDIINGKTESPRPSWANGTNTQRMGYDVNNWTELLSADWDTAIKHIWNTDKQGLTRYVDIANNQSGRVNWRATEDLLWNASVEWGPVSGAYGTTNIPDTLKYTIPIFYGPVANPGRGSDDMPTNTRFKASEVFYRDKWGNTMNFNQSPYFDKLETPYKNISFDITLDDATGYNNGILYMATSPWVGNSVPSTGKIILQGTGARTDGGIDLTKGVTYTVSASNLQAGVIYFKILCGSGTKAKIKELNNYLLEKEE